MLRQPHPGMASGAEDRRIPRSSAWACRPSGPKAGSRRRSCRRPPTPPAAGGTTRSKSTFDKIDWDWMADHIRIYGAYLWELCTAPFCHSSSSAWLINSRRAFASWQRQEARSASAALGEHAEAFELAARQLDEAAKHWNAKISCQRGGRTASCRTPQHLHQASQPRPPANRQHCQGHLRPRHVFVHAAVDGECLASMSSQASAHAVERARALAARDPARTRPQPRQRRTRRRTPINRRHLGATAVSPRIAAALILGSAVAVKLRLTCGRCQERRASGLGGTTTASQSKDGSRCVSKSNTAVSETMSRAPVRRRTSSARSGQMRR